LRPRAFAKVRLVITAAHCLPKFPRAFAAESCELRTYPNLLGSLANNKNGKKNDVWAECLFADPIADIAVPADSQRPRKSRRCGMHRHRNNGRFKQKGEQKRGSTGHLDEEPSGLALAILAMKETSLRVRAFFFVA